MNIKKRKADMMKVIKGKTGCLCHNCDREESEYMISNKGFGSFKVFWASGETDCEIAFCEKCARELFKQLSDVLQVDIE